MKLLPDNFGEVSNEMEIKPLDNLHSCRYHPDSPSYASSSSSAILIFLLRCLGSPSGFRSEKRARANWIASSRLGMALRVLLDLNDGDGEVCCW